jgi:hypothetical protein
MHSFFHVIILHFGRLTQSLSIIIVTVELTIIINNQLSCFILPIHHNNICKTKQNITMHSFFHVLILHFERLTQSLSIIIITVELTIIINNQLSCFILPIHHNNIAIKQRHCIHFFMLSFFILGD